MSRIGPEALVADIYVSHETLAEPRSARTAAAVAALDREVIAPGLRVTTGIGQTCGVERTGRDRNVSSRSGHAATRPAGLG